MSIPPVDLSEIHSRLLSIEEKMAGIAEDTSKIRVDGFSRITKLETQVAQIVETDIPNLKQDVQKMKESFSPKNILIYAGGISTLFVTLTEVARALRLVP